VPLPACDVVVDDASCRVRDALVVLPPPPPPLLAGAACALGARRTFECWFVGALLVGTTRTAGGEKNNDGASGLPP